MSKLAENCEKFIQIGIRYTLILVPLFFITVASNPFTLPKTLLFRMLVFVMLTAWIIELVEKKKTDFYQVKFVAPLGVLLVIFILSTIFSVEPSISFWGFYTRLDGLFSFFSYLIFFLLVATHFFDQEQIKKTVKLMVSASFFIALYAILQHYGMDFFHNWSLDPSKRPISTLGNPLHLGVYLLLMIPITLSWLIYKIKDQKERWFIGLTLTLQVIAIIFSYTRSAWIGLLVALVWFGFLTGIKHKKKILWIGMLILAGLGIIMGSFMIKPDANWVNQIENPVIERFVSSFTMKDTSVLARMTVWEMAWSAIKQNPILGYGADTFIYGFQTQFDPKLADYDLQEYFSAHNLLLDWTYAHGFVGLIALLWLIINFFQTGIKWLLNTDDKLRKWLMIAALSGAIGYLVQVQFGFNYPTSSAYWFFLLGMTAAFYQPSRGEATQWQFKDRPQKAILIYWIVSIIILAIIIILNFLPLVANIYFRSAKATQLMSQRLKYYETSCNLAFNHNDIEYRTGLAQNLMIWSSMQKPEATDEINEILAKAIEKLKITEKKYPWFLDNYVLEGKLYLYWGNEADQSKLAEADGYFHKALELSPNKQRIYWEWGNALLFNKDNDSAIEKYKQAIEIDPTVARPYLELSQAYAKIGDQQQAKLYRDKWLEISEK